MDLVINNRALSHAQANTDTAQGPPPGEGISDQPAQATSISRDAITSADLHALPVPVIELIAKHLQPRDLGSLIGSSGTLAKALRVSTVSNTLRPGRYLQKFLSWQFELGCDHATLSPATARETALLLHNAQTLPKFVARKQHEAMYRSLCEDQFPAKTLANRLVIAAPSTVRYSATQQREILRRAIAWADVQVKSPLNTFEAICAVIGSYPADAQLLATRHAITRPELPSLSLLCNRWASLDQSAQYEIREMLANHTSVETSHYIAIANQTHAADAKTNAILINRAHENLAANQIDLSLLNACFANAERFSEPQRKSFLEAYKSVNSHGRVELLSGLLIGIHAHPLETQDFIIGELRTVLGAAAERALHFFQIRQYFGELGHALPKLDESRQADIIRCVESIHNEYLRFEAIAMLARLTPQLQPSGKETLANAALHLSEPEHKAQALAKLNIHAAVFDQPLRQRLTDATLQLPMSDDLMPFIITALHGMHDAPDADRLEVVNRYFQAPVTPDLATSIEHMKPIMSVLPPSEQGKVVAFAHRMPGLYERTLALESITSVLPNAHPAIQLQFLELNTLYNFQGIKTVLTALAKHLTALDPVAQRKFWTSASINHNMQELGVFLEDALEPLEKLDNTAWEKAYAAIPEPRSKSRLSRLAESGGSYLGPILERRRHAQPAYQDSLSSTQEALNALANTTI